RCPAPARARRWSPGREPAAACGTHRPRLRESRSWCSGRPARATVNRASGGGQCFHQIFEPLAVQAGVRAALGLVAIDPPRLQQGADRLGRLLRDKEQFPGGAGAADDGVKRAVGGGGEPAHPAGDAPIGHLFRRVVPFLVDPDDEDVGPRAPLLDRQISEERGERPARQAGPVACDRGGTGRLPEPREAGGKHRVRALARVLSEELRAIGDRAVLAEVAHQRRTRPVPALEAIQKPAHVSDTLRYNRRSCDSSLRSVLALPRAFLPRRPLLLGPPPRRPVPTARAGRSRRSRKTLPPSFIRTARRVIGPARSRRCRCSLTKTRARTRVRFATRSARGTCPPGTPMRRTVRSKTNAA